MRKSAEPYSTLATMNRMVIPARTDNGRQRPHWHLGCRAVTWLALFLSGANAVAQSAPATLARTAPLEWTGDTSARMVEGIDRFFSRATQESTQDRPRFWKRDFTSPEAYAQSVNPNRERLRRQLGAVDLRFVVAGLEFLGSTEHDSRVAETDTYTVHSVRWLVFDHVYG